METYTADLDREEARLAREERAVLRAARSRRWRDAGRAMFAFWALTLGFALYVFVPAPF